MLVPTATWNESMAEYMKANGIKELFLNYAWGWEGKDLSFLRMVPDLVAFSIIHWTIDDISPINALHDLKSLNVNTYCKTKIDFTNFTHLRTCALEWRAKAKTVFGCKSLHTLSLSRYSGKDTVAFSGLTELESLALVNSPIKDLRGLRQLKKLKHLELSYLRKLPTLSGIEALTKLKELEIYSCRSVTSIDEIASLTNLRRLLLIDTWDIESLKPLESLSKLETFLFYGDTNVVDGDLSPLTKIPCLSEVAFQNRRHYSHKEAELLKLAR